MTDNVDIPDALGDRPNGRSADVPPHLARLLDADDDARGLVLKMGFDWDTTRPTVAVVEAVAEATDRAATALPSLASVLDPDAVDMLFAPGTGDDVSLTFGYAGTGVRVHGDGTVEIATTG